MNLRALDLCAGAGGLSLGLQRAGWEVGCGRGGAMKRPTKDDNLHRIGTWHGAGVTRIVAAVWGAHGWHWAVALAGFALLMVAVAVSEAQR